MTQFSTQSHIRTAFYLTAILMSSSIGAAQTAPTTSASTTVSNRLTQLRQAPASATPVKAPIDMATTMEGQGQSCCPAVMSGPFSQYFKYDQLPGKNITQSYGLRFLTNFVYPNPVVDTIPQTLALDQQMMPFSYYIGVYGAGYLPLGYVANSVILRAEIRDVTIPTGPNGTAIQSYWNHPSAAASSTGIYPVRAWWSSLPTSNNPYNVWDGSNPSYFHNQYSDGNSHIALQPNHTYMMKMSLTFYYKKTANDDTWFPAEIKCSNMRQYFSWNVKVNNLKTAPGTTEQPQIQFDEVK